MNSLTQSSLSGPSSGSLGPTVNIINEEMEASHCKGKFTNGGQEGIFRDY